MVSALDSASRGPGLRPGRVNALCTWARYLTFTELLLRAHIIWSLALLCVPHLHGEAIKRTNLIG